jgi:hypothetical protein
LVATVSAFLTVGFFGLFGQAHDELESEDRGYLCSSFARLDLPVGRFDGALCFEFFEFVALDATRLVR